MLKRRKKKNTDNANLEMTPMIDVVFQLLIFFIVTLKQEDILGNLDALRPQPEDGPPPTNPQEPLTILITDRGLFFHNQYMTEIKLKESLQAIARRDKDTSVIIKCDGPSRHGDLVRALDICTQVGLSKLAVFSM